MNLITKDFYEKWERLSVTPGEFPEPKYYTFMRLKVFVVIYKSPSMFSRDLYCDVVRYEGTNGAGGAKLKPIEECRDYVQPKLADYLDSWYALRAI